MTAPVSRDTWQRALIAGPCKTISRDVRMTLLACSRFMTKDGRLSRPEDVLTAAADVEPRALGRHRKAAVEGGWLVRESLGHHGRSAVYRASLPVSSVRLQSVKADTHDSLPDDVASHYPTAYAAPKQVADDAPSTKTLRTHTAATRFVYPLDSQRSQLLGRGVISTIPNRKPGKHASHSDNSRSVIAGFAFVSARVATTEGAA